MSNQETDIDKYLKRFSYLRQWVNECVCCHHKGYKPEMPEPPYTGTAITTVKLRRLLSELALNEAGLCEQCGAAFSNKQTE